MRQAFRVIRNKDEMRVHRDCGHYLKFTITLNLLIVNDNAFAASIITRYVKNYYYYPTAE